MNNTPHTIDIAVDQLVQSPFNRKVVNSDYLKELAADIKVNGLLQALTVRKSPSPDGAAAGRMYQIVIGEHRWRAATKAGLRAVPCRVIDVDDQAVILLQLSENLLHNKNNPLDEAAAYKHLEVLGLDAKAIAVKVKKSVANVYQALALNKCSNTLREAVRDGRISGSHAARLQSVDESDHKSWIDRITRNDLSVRDIELELKRKAEQEKGRKQRAKMKKSEPKKNTKLGQLSDHAKHEQAWRMEVARQILKKIKQPSQADIADLTAMEMSMVNGKTVKVFKPKTLGQKIALALFDSELSGWNKPRSLLALAKRYKVNVNKVKKSVVKQSKAKGAK